MPQSPFAPVYRAAVKSDSAAMVELMKPAVDSRLVLPRTQVEIEEHIERFLVAEAGGRVIGCVALRDFSEGLFEVRSLVVDKSCEGRGVGSELVKLAMSRARECQGLRLFSLTYRPRLFARLGFAQVDKGLFPQKVWADCSKCAKREQCDEIAMLYRWP